VKKILLTGGGTAGHVTPNIALIPYLYKDNWSIHYIGTKDGIERDLISRYDKIKYHPIESGKLRRYVDIKNFTDPFKVIVGIAQSLMIIRRVNPSVIFSKGGFVSVPVCIGGKLSGIPVIIHESDFTPGLANRIASKFASKVCTSFPETVLMFKGRNSIYTGTPIRDDLFKGDPEKGRKFCGFTNNKPVVMIVGGSLGAQAINKAIRQNVSKLTDKFNIAHICGKGNTDGKMTYTPGYMQFEYLNEQMADVLAASDVVVSRAGANSINELLALKKPNLLIPLPKGASRGDQIANAQAFEDKGYSKVLEQEDLNADLLYDAIVDLYDKRDRFISKMQSSGNINGLENVLKLIREYAK